MPVTIGKKPVKVGNIFACRKLLDEGAEADVFTIACCLDVVLKIYRYYEDKTVVNNYKTYIMLSKVGLATKVYGGVIVFRKDVTNGLCYDENKYGILCEKVEVKTRKTFTNQYTVCEEYQKYREEVHLLRDIINDLYDKDWDDDSDYNVGVNKSGDIVCIDVGVGIATGYEDLHFKFDLR